jgi:dephospho-CoA kinase
VQLKNDLGTLPESESLVTSIAVSQPFAQSRRIPVIGIVGGIGSGKSAVANWAASQTRVTVLNADNLGHEALLSADVKQSLCARFGVEILGLDGNIDRSILARRVFGADPQHMAARHDLQEIVHPEIDRRISEEIALAAAQGQSAVLLDAAVLLEAGWRSKCDLVVFVDAPAAVRLQRVRERRGWAEEELCRREASQWSLTDKRREADLIVTNDGSVEQGGQQLLAALRRAGVVSPSSAAEATPARMN